MLVGVQLLAHTWRASRCGYLPLTKLEFDTEDEELILDGSELGNKRNINTLANP